MTRLAWFASSTAVMVLASAIFADQANVRTRDGNSYHGEVVERPDNVSVTMRGVETIIPRSDIISIDPIGPAVQELQAKLEKLGPNDVDGRVALARDAFDKHEYSAARLILEGALEIDPNSREATQMLEVVQSQIRLERTKTGSQPTTTPTTAPPRAISGQAGIEKRLLTAADMDVIRRLELRATDTGVRIQFMGDVKRKFAESQNTPFSQFNSRSPTEQAMAIIKGDDSLRDKVKVMNDPPSLLEFRRHILPLVLGSCAASGCHGGPQGGGFVLLSPADTDVLAYTNFYIMETFTKPTEGPPGAGRIFGGNTTRRLVDRGHGDQSLLANYGLPTAIAEYDHPMVNGKPITPVFRTKDDARYKMVVDWMNNQLAPIDPDYDIHFTPPSAAPPSSSPAE